MSNKPCWKDSLGRWHTRALFIETSNNKDACPPLYTIQNESLVRDGITYPSLKKIYMEYSHIPGYEYEFAQEHLGGWEHWMRLFNSTLKETFLQWREELTIKQKATALKGIIAQSLDGTPTAFQAGKYLVEEGWIEKKGRPKKEDIEKAAKRAASVRDEIEEDLERVGLSLVK